MALFKSMAKMANMRRTILPDVCGSDPLMNANRGPINTLALVARLPTMHSIKFFFEAGALVSYGARYPDLFRRAGDYVDKILRGAKPADLPVEQPTKFDLVINLITAKALGLQVPPALLRSEEHTSELQSLRHLVCRLLLEKK